MAWWLSWLERRPVTAEVVGSNPIRVVCLAIALHYNCISFIWGLSSAGRASALQAEGHRFEPYRSHFLTIYYGGIAQLARAHGSYPWCRWFKSSSRYLYGILAQLGEHLPYKQRVTGSSPVGPINLIISSSGGIGRRKGLKIPR